MAEANESQQARLEKAERFLRTAGQAIRDGDYESSVSRAYYAVFHSIHAVLAAQETMGKHSQVIDEIVRWNRRYTRLNAIGLLPGHRDFPRSLHGLHLWREAADYALGETDEQRARVAVDFARRFVSTVKEYFS